MRAKITDVKPIVISLTSTERLMEKGVRQAWQMACVFHELMRVLLFYWHLQISCLQPSKE